MSKNKGVIGIGLVIAIVLGIVVVGGGAYYLGVNQNKKVVDVPEYKYEVPTPPFLDESNYVPPTLNCNSNSPSTIKLISPNGGEVYTAGQKITVKWESCNMEPIVNISLLRKDIDKIDKNIETEGYNESHSNDYGGFVLGGFDYDKGTENDGIQEVILPQLSTNLIPGKYYYMGVGGVTTNINNQGNYLDYSDNLFTINSSPNIISSCTSDKGKVMTYIEALKIAKASSCNSVGTFTGEYSCNPNGGGLVDVFMKPIDKPMCGFACRVSIDTGKAEEGWMCTGALLPDNN